MQESRLFCEHSKSFGVRWIEVMATRINLSAVRCLGSALVSSDLTEGELKSSRMVLACPVLGDFL